jgi:predicted nucleic acid-binding protein
VENLSILIDTSIIIDHLRKQNKQNSVLFISIDKYLFNISTVVEFEIFLGATDKKKLQDVMDIMQLCVSLPLTSDIAQQSAAIYQKLKKQNILIEIRDIFIAATAIVHDLPFMTLNNKHFERIETRELVTIP